MKAERLERVVNMSQQELQEFFLKQKQEIVIRYKRVIAEIQADQEVLQVLHRMKREELSQLKLLIKDSLD